MTARYNCKHPWPCFGKPTIIFHDRGKIFTSERVTQVVVDRFKITTEQAPPYAPSAKGTVEALFTWVTRKFTHRLPGTTKATPADRGAYDSAAEAEKAGITLDVLEKLFIQAIVDGYMQEWDKLRRQTRIALWEDAVQKKGVPRWMGSQDDLKLLLRKCQNSGQGVVTEGIYPHVSHKKATQCSHFPHSLLNLAVVSPLCVSFPCRVLSSDTSRQTTQEKPSSLRRKESFRGIYIRR
ncbi:MAG: hypothetical protein ACJ8BW_00160 [Ktedonobacteraceae bacterium]